MNYRKLTTVFTSAFFSLSLTLAAGAQCPAIGYAPGCNEVITATPGGSFSVVGLPGNGTNYDGSDDALVGFVNKSGAPVYSIGLNGNGVDIFGFDGDGVDTFAGSTSNSTDTTGYGGPDAYFTNISSDLTTGTVDFVTPIANGGSTYFSLEESFSQANPPTPIPTGVTPEPNSLLLFGSGILGAAGMVRRRVMAR